MRNATVLLLFAALLVGCANGQQADGEVEESEPVLGSDEDPRGALAPEQEEFWANLAKYCGQAFPGHAAVIIDGDARRDSLYAGRDMIAHFRQCFDDELRIPGHIDDDRSRTWIVTRVDGGLDLRHDHREEDGSDASNTMYGAATEDAGTPLRQDFTRGEGEGGWVLEYVPGERFSYGNRTEDEWLVRFDFDLADPIDPPPPPWGYEDEEAHPPPG